MPVSRPVKRCHGSANVSHLTRRQGRRRVESAPVAEPAQVIMTVGMIMQMRNASGQEGTVAGRHTTYYGYPSGPMTRRSGPHISIWRASFTRMLIRVRPKPSSVATKRPWRRSMQPTIRFVTNRAGRAYKASTNTRAASDAGLRPPMAGECDRCGHAPAAVLGFSYQVAWLVSGRRYAVQASLCRNCALALGRAQQNKTLWAGWWGILAFFTNFAVVYRNARGLRYAAKWLATPKPVRDVVAPMREPARIGSSIARRGGFWFATALLVAVIGGGVVLAANQRPTPTFSVGNCVSGTAGTTVHPVSCSDSHDGKIIAEVNSQNDCPSSADGYVDEAGSVLCIDSSQ